MARVARRVLAGAALVVSSLTAGAWLHAQSVKPFPLPDATVISGPDIGFRVTGQKGDTVSGELVVRIDGKWKLAQFAMSVKPVAK